MTTTGRLSTCGICGFTIQQTHAGWQHVTPPARPHQPEPDDSHVSGPDDDARKDCCEAYEDDDCDPVCDCGDCEEERALDDDADACRDRVRNP